MCIRDRDGFVRLQADEVRSDAQHIADRQERLVGQLDKPLLEDGLCRAHEAMVAVGVGRIPLAGLVCDEIRGAGVVEGATGGGGEGGGRGGGGGADKTLFSLQHIPCGRGVIVWSYGVR